MKPNFEEMSRDELRAYVLEHRDDMEAIRLLFTPQSGVEVKRYPPVVDGNGYPIEENIRIMEEAIRQRIEEEDRKKRDRNAP
jgi:hypothetical protein